MSDLKSKPKVTKKCKYEKIEYEFVNANSEFHKIGVKISQDNILLFDTYYGMSYDVNLEEPNHIKQYTPNLMTKEQFIEYANLLKEFADSLVGDKDE